MHLRRVWQLSSRRNYDMIYSLSLLLSDLASVRRGDPACYILSHTRSLEKGPRGEQARQSISGGLGKDGVAVEGDARDDGTDGALQVDIGKAGMDGGRRVVRRA